MEMREASRFSTGNWFIHCIGGRCSTAEMRCTLPTEASHGAGPACCEGGRPQNHNKAGPSCCLSQPALSLATKPQHRGPSREASSAVHLIFAAVHGPPRQYCKSTNGRSRCVRHLRLPIKSCGELKQGCARIFGQSVRQRKKAGGEVSKVLGLISSQFVESPVVRHISILSNGSFRRTSSRHKITFSQN